MAYVSYRKSYMRKLNVYRVKKWRKYILLFIIFNSVIHHLHAQINIDSLLQLSTNSVSDTLLIKELSETAEALMDEDLQKSVRISLEAIELSKRIAYKKGLIYNYQLLGSIYYQQQAYEQAIVNYDKCLDNSLAVGQSSTAMMCYINMGVIFFTQGSNNRALDYFLQALTFASDEAKETLYNNIGLVYLKEKSFDDALAYFTKSLELKKANANQLGIAVSYNNIGEVYSDMGKADIAFVYFQKSYTISKEINDKEGMVYSLNNFGEIKENIHELDSSIVYFKEALRISEKLNNQMLIAQSLYYIGHSYFVGKEYSKAKSYLLDCYKISETLGLLPDIKKSSDLLSHIYKDDNNYKQSYRFLNIYKTASDSLSKYETTKQLLKLKFDYQFKLKAEESKRLLELKNHEYKRSRFKLTTIIFVLIILLVLAVFVVARIKQRMKINRIEKEKIELKKNNLEKELEFKNKEIIEKVLKIIEKNELIETTIKRLNDFSLSLPIKKKAEIDIISKELKSMEMKNQWKEFHHYFTKIYSKFFDNLEKDYPELTTNEKRLCAYLKLNMGTKDIAALTFQNYKSVEVARTRLRKRFNLTNKNISFQEFFGGYN